MSRWDPLLVTAADVVAHAEGTVDRLRDDDGLALVAAERAQAALDDWLGFPAFVHEAVSRTYLGTAARVVGFDLAYVNGSAGGPGGSGFRFNPVGPASLALDAGVTLDLLGRLDVGAAEDRSVVRYLSGWRRPEQTDEAVLAVLGEVSGPDGNPLVAARLSVVPEAPRAIVGALAEAAVVVAKRLSIGAGVRRTETDLGAGVTRAESVPLSEIQAVFGSALHRFRHVSV